MLNSIKNQLEALGYNSYVRIINDKECLHSFIEGNLNSVFFIKDDGNKILMEYFIGQIPVEKEFKKIEDVLNFIKEVFPH